MKKLSRIVLICLLALLSFSCTNEVYDGDGYTELKLAVILPGGENSQYKNVIDFFLSNFEYAQKNLSKKIKFVLEYYDENLVDMGSLASSLAKRNDVVAIIGPIRSLNVDVVASACMKTSKPLLVPTASSEELIRKYSVSNTGSIREPFFWTLAEPDIAQCEAILSQILTYGGSSVSLIASDDLYGQTYTSWLPFQAYEMNLNHKASICIETEYGDSPEAVSLSVGISSVFESGADYIVCALSEIEDIKEVIEYMADNSSEISSSVLFTDTACNSKLLTTMDAHKLEGIEGLAIYSDPATGFEITYKELYGTAPINGEAQLYDCFLVISHAVTYCNVKDKDLSNKAINDVIKNMTAERFQHAAYVDWTKLGMWSQFTTMDTLSSYVLHGLLGASGYITFDKESYGSRLYSLYSNWIIADNEFVILDYTIADVDNRLSSNVISWNWNIQKSQEFKDEETDIIYAEHKDNWALLIAASDGWYNYRHQADVLEIYQTLKANGFDDDHIILIMEDDLAYNSRNKFPGVIKTSIDGENLYTEDLEIDYKTSELSLDNLQDIFIGEASEETPIVLETNENSNIFVFWSGHGSNRMNNPELGYFEWAGAKNGFTTEMLEETFLTMEANESYRKVLFVAETCYSLSVLNGLEGIEGVLGFAAANGSEKSFADVYSSDLKVWLSNRFTRNFVEKANNPNTTFYDLYLHMFKKTLGSHVSIVNEDSFSNLYSSTIEEFIIAE